MAEEKKSLWEKAKELFATYGNPSGGMVHKDIPDEKKTEAAPAEPAKEEKKSSIKESILKYKDEVAKLYATYGNPSGGMVHNDMPAEKKEAAPAEPASAKEEKKEEKSSYKEEVAKLFATYGNPSGGMVHNDMPAEKQAPAPAPAKEEKAEKKSSFKEDIAKLYATYGNPSGGMAHNDMPAAKNAAVAKKLADRAR